MDNTSLAPTSTALNKALAVFLTAGALLLGGLLIAPDAQAHLRAAITPAVTTADTIANEAQTLTEEYEAVCQDPSWGEAEALTAGTGSGEAFDGVTESCTSFAVENADFVTKVEAATSIWTDLGTGFGEVTETVRAAVAAGDIEEAIRELFAQSETEAN